MFKERLLNENIELYESFYSKSAFKTIYHHPHYLLAEELAEAYNIYLYIYEQGEDFVILPSVKRRVNDIDVFADEKEEYFDLMTPHEYSGVLANRYELDLFRNFYRELRHYCFSNNIIFQFIRFNPYSEEYRAAEDFDIKLADFQNWVDCTEDVLQSFKRRKAQYVKYAVKNGMQYIEMERNQENIKTFFRYYTKAMDRLKAKKFLYFNANYFLKLCQSNFVKLFFVKNKETDFVLAGTIILCDQEHKRLYYHLGFRNAEAGNIHSMEFMIYAASEWAKEHGYESVHLGGGSDSLHRFKDGCTDKMIEYYCGSIIYHHKVYQRLSDIYEKRYVEEKNSPYLPIYRSKE